MSLQWNFTLLLWSYILLSITSAMIDKYATVQLLLQSKDENIWSILNMCLSPDFKPLDYGKSLIPKRKLKELHKMNEAYKRWELKTKSWEEVKKSLEKNFKTWVIA